ncbi:MAG: FkbM family methyltransferase [Bacteroidia bacterium]|nr:FkbM family methyltransferase [Bacteroidia bacterium]
MKFSYLKALFSFFKEKVRRFVHPKIYKTSVTVFEDRKSFYSLFLNPGDLVFDVGANLGNRVAIFFSLKNKVVAIEPQKYCYYFLKIKFSDSIVLKKCALGSKKERSFIYINSRASTISSMSQDWISKVKKGRFGNHEWNKKEEIEVDTLDNLISQYGLPKFIKIDVEGFEIEVLKGLSQPVQIISFEYTIPEQAENVFLCLNRLHEISENYLFNFSLDESNEFVLSKWINYNDLLLRIEADKNFLGGFGDIYASLNSIN